MISVYSCVQPLNRLCVQMFLAINSVHVWATVHHLMAKSVKTGGESVISWKELGAVVSSDLTDNVLMHWLN